jgi:hypothetical protein
VEHPVVVPVRDEESVGDGLERELDTVRQIERGERRMVDGPGAEVGEDREAPRSIPPVDADDAVPPTSGPTTVTNTYMVVPTNATSIAPPMKISRCGSPLANVVALPVVGSMRVIWPSSASGT